MSYEKATMVQLFKEQIMNDFAPVFVIYNVLPQSITGPLEHTISSFGRKLRIAVLGGFKPTITVTAKLVKFLGRSVTSLGKGTNKYCCRLNSSESCTFHLYIL